MRIHKEHRIELPASRFLELTFDGDFQKRMNTEAMGTDNFEVLERSVEEEMWRMRNRVTPKDNMPGFLKKLIGGSFFYEEQLTRRRGEDTVTATMAPSTLKDKMTMGYEMRVVSDGDNGCRRIMDWNVEIRIFGLGGQIEKFAAAEIERGMESSARFFNNQGKAHGKTAG